MTITLDGTLGVTTPAETITGTLAVTGITTVAAGSAAAPSIVSTTGTADTGQFFPAADTIAYSTAGTERMRIDSSGNVGLGTSSPRFVSGYTSLGVNGTSGGLIDIFSNGTRIGAYAGDGAGIVVGSITSIPLSFVTTNTERMRITSGGNLGLGTTSPATNPVITVQATGSGPQGGMRLLSNQTESNGANYEAYGRRSDANGGAGFAPGVLLARVNTAPAAITSNMTLGRVGFGGSYDGTDANVVYGAQIAGVSSGTYSASSAATDIAFYTTPSGTAGVPTVGSSAAAGTERMRIDSSGNVFMGTTTQVDGARLSLYGGSLAGLGFATSQNATTVNMAIDSLGGLTTRKSGADFWHFGRSSSANCVSSGGSWVNSSDERLKENIVTLPDALNKVCSLRGVSFNRISSGQPEIGLIAQEVQQVYPDVVEVGDYLGLNYGALVGALVEAIKDLKTITETLTARITALETE